jgi:hypothetical protein
VGSRKTLVSSVSNDTNNEQFKTKIMTWWILFGVAITFLTLILAGAFKKEK